MAFCVSVSSLVPEPGQGIVHMRTIVRNLDHVCPLKNIEFNKLKLNEMILCARFIRHHFWGFGNYLCFLVHLCCNVAQFIDGSQKESTAYLSFSVSL